MYKKPKLKAKPIERVYKNGREAIVVSAKKKVLSLKSSRLIAQRVIKDKQYAPVAAAAIQGKQFTPAIKIDEYELPSYNTTKLTLMPRDPFWIYAYWELSNYSIESVKNKLGGSLDNTRVTLRMYDVTCIDFNGYNANSYFDIEVGAQANNWYINLWKDNVSYCAELGILTNYGAFFPLTRSNFVQTPRASSSNRIEEIWMDLKEELHSDRDKGMLEPLLKVKKSLESTYSILSKRRRVYLRDDDIRKYYSRLSPLLRKIMFSRILRKIMFSRISSKRLHRYLYSRGELEKFYLQALREGNKLGRKILLGSSGMTFLGASESLGPGASEFTQPAKDRKFFFEIGTELIVYGRTEPDAEVWLGDKKVNLRPDGTFSMRFALPDGKIPLDFTAISKDKIDTRKITTIVERKTN